MFEPGEVRVEVFDDDPLVVNAGTEERRSRQLTVLMPWWLSPGPDLSWTEVQRGDTVKLTGAHLTVVPDIGLVLRIPDDYISKLVASIDDIMGELE